MDQNPFQTATLQLLRECFEGKPEGQNYTWFVEGKEGIFDALSSVSAERASIKPSERSSTIAAHGYHILYALRGANAYYGRPKPEGTWDDSWSKETATDQEWSDLMAAIQDEYLFLLVWFETADDWSDEQTVIGGLAQLPHMAFHLGALRQLLKIV